MKNRPITIEHILFALAFLLALVSRLWALAATPLGDTEAALALQAAHLFSDRTAAIDPQPAYILMTSVLFAIFQATDFTARLIPALAGSLLVLSPLLFRRQLGRWSAILLAFGLALDPGLTAVSRQAGGMMIGLACTVLALGYYIRRSSAAAGICLALALLSGPNFLPGWLALAIAVLVFGRSSIAASSDDAPAPFSWRNALIWAAGTLIVVGTLLFLQPRGLSAAAASLGTYFQGWGRASGISLGQLPLALIFYEFLPLVLGLVGGFRSLFKAEPIDRFLFFWFGIALLLALVYPSRQVIDLSWSLLPLWVLAARQAIRWAGIVREHRFISAGQAALVAALITVVLVNLAALVTQTTLSEAQVFARWAQLAAALILLAILTLLVAGGWSIPTALNGLTWGVAIVAVVLTVAAMWNAAGRGNYPDRELWRVDAYPAEQDLMLKSLSEISDWAQKNRQPLDLIVSQESPSLRWALKDYPQAEYVSVLPMDTPPSTVITAQTDALQLTAPYSGQDFTIYTAPEWPAMVAREWLEWGFYRRAPVYTTYAILWVRTDLFPGAATNPTP